MLLNKNNKEKYLFSFLTDFLMIGGASLIVFIFIYFLIEKNYNTFTIGWIMFYLSFLVNNPHFLISYQLLYYDYSSKIFSEFKFFWAGVIVPILLIGFLSSALILSSIQMIAYFIAFMFITVGWHYVKQIWGCMVVTSTLKEFYYNKFERISIKSNLILLWLYTLAIANEFFREDLYFYQIQYYSLEFGEFIVSILQILLILSSIIVLFLFIKKYKKEKKIIPVNSLTAFLSIYIWFLPVIYHPVFFIMVPFFHSLQYLLFVMALKKNQIKEEINKETTKNRTKNNFLSFFSFTYIVLTFLIIYFLNKAFNDLNYNFLNYILFENFPFLSLLVIFSLFFILSWFIIFKYFFKYIKFIIYIIFSLFLGIIFFHTLPYYLDSIFNYKPEIFPQSIFLAIFILFINVHHYFIDNVIWRKDNKDLQKYLLKK